MGEYLTPGVYLEPVRPAPALTAARTDIAGFLGLCERGPLNDPTRVDSWHEFQATFGPCVGWGFLAYAVKGFFENGGRTCFVVRIAGSTCGPAMLPLLDSLGNEVLRITAATPGTWAQRLAISLTRIRPGELKFSLHVLWNGAVVESFADVSIDRADANYVAHAVNGTPRRPASRWITIEDRIVSSPRTSADLPDPQASGLTRGTGYLQGGDDGLTSLKRQDFLGRPAIDDEPATGLVALTSVEAVTLLCVPDIHVRAVEPPLAAPPSPPRDPCSPCAGSDPTAPAPGAVVPPVPPLFSDTDVNVVQQAMIAHCEARLDCFAILEVPLNAGSTRARSIERVRQWRQQLASDRGFAALYHPWIKVVDPLHVTEVRAVPPCGHIAGMYARVDLSRGVHKAPANEELFWAEDVLVRVDEVTHGVLNVDGINVIIAAPGRNIRVQGARTVNSDTDWRFVNVRRLMSMIEQSVRRSMQWTVFEPNDWPLRSAIEAALSGFLRGLWRQGAFAGATAEESFFVRCDQTNNTQADTDNGRLIAQVGVAPTIPAEFVVFRLGRTIEALEISEEPK